MPGQATITIRDKQWQVSIADTPWELTQGLGGIPQLLAGTGTLFDLVWEQIVQVTTVPMLFPLDIAFFSETLVITEIYRNIEPGYMVTSTLPARYFLEVNAGELEAIESGDRALVEFLPLEEMPVIMPDWVSTMTSFMGFVVMGTLVVSIVQDLVKGMLGEPEKSPALLPQTKPEARFKPGEIVHYKGERVRVLDHIGDRVSIWIPSRQDEVWVKTEKLRKIARPAATEREGLVLKTRSPLTNRDEVLEYRVEKNDPHDTWGIVELWPGGTVRSPFRSKEEAIKREEEIGQHYGWKLRRVEFSQVEIDLLNPQRFPRRTRALNKLKGHDVIYVHDDGDLTVRSRDKFYVVTTEGQLFEQKEYLAQTTSRSPELKPTGTCYADAWRFLINEEEGELIHGTVFTGGRRMGHAWVETATGYIWEPETGRYFTLLGFKDAFAPVIEGRYTAEEAAIMAARTKNLGPWAEEERRQYLKEKSPAVIPEYPRHPPLKDEVEFLPDSPEFLSQTIDAIGYRDRLDNAFQRAIARAKGLSDIYEGLRKLGRWR